MFYCMIRQGGMSMNMYKELPKNIISFTIEDLKIIVKEGENNERNNNKERQEMVHSS